MRPFSVSLALAFVPLLGAAAPVTWDQVASKLVLCSAKRDARETGARLVFRVREAVAHPALQKDEQIEIPFEQDHLFLAGARRTGAPQAPIPEFPQDVVPCASFQGRQVFLLTPNLFMEHFRLRNIEPVFIQSPPHAVDRLRITFQSVTPITFGDKRVLEEGTLVCAQASKLGSQYRVDFQSAIWGGSDAVLTRKAEPTTGIVLLALPTDMNLADFRQLSADERRVMDWWLDAPDARSPLGVPVEIDLFTGLTWSNLTRTKESKGWLEERGMLRLEARKLWFMGGWKRWFLGTTVEAEISPDRAYTFPAPTTASTVRGDTPTPTVAALRSTRSFVGALELTGDRMISEYASLGAGMRYTTSHGADPLANGTDSADKAYTQRHPFVRLLWHDPKWKGTFVEFGAWSRDPYFVDPLVKDAERRIIARGRLNWRPDRFIAASFFVEGLQNRSQEPATKLPDESRITLGMRVDLKNFFVF